jgi:hypothetical protein
LTMPVPAHPKIYHIVHVDRLASVVADEYLWSDVKMVQRQRAGTTIGMSQIKERRLNELHLGSHPALRVGQCVPFYFCPRSVMLFLIHKRNEDLTYKGGQEPIVHLVADLHATIAWADAHNRRWAFTLSNAGAYYFEDRSDAACLGEINWEAVKTNQWSGNGVSRSIKEGKQAEFLVETSFPWQLVERIGVFSPNLVHQVWNILQQSAHRPKIDVKRDWYY